MNLIQILFINLFYIVTSLNVKPKYCENCKFFIPYEQYNEYGKCSKFPLINNLGLVSKEKEIKDYFYCATARCQENMCGIEAKEYVKKRMSKKQDKKNTAE